MRLLELFCGTSSWGKVAKKYGYEVISLDIKQYKNQPKPTLLVDICEWKYKNYPKGYFDIIVASPPCIHYSLMKNIWIGRMKKDGLYTREKHQKDLEWSDNLVLTTFDIIDYFSPQYYFIENPSSSRLRKRAFMELLPYYIVDYCKYSNWGYKKRTIFWTNLKDFSPLLCKNDCENMLNDKQHTHTLGSHGKACWPQLGVKAGGSNRLVKYRIPPKLIEAFLDHIKH